MSSWMARTELLSHRAGEFWLIVDPVTDRVHSLNPSAFWIWYHCDGRAGADDLARWLSEDAGIALAAAAADVSRGLEELHRENLVVEHHGGIL